MMGMGNREDLLSAAKRCLYEKGYARTTARDIVAEAGTSLASIGYHFGSKDALLNAAVLAASEEWGDELQRVLATDTDPHAGPIDRFETVWTRVIELFEAHRGLWSATFEMVAQIDSAPEVRKAFAEGLYHAKLGLAELVNGIDPALDEQAALKAGAFNQALLTGVMTQWLIDPAGAPSGRDLADVLRMFADRPA
jgi:AcrR family transcriptional regulator